MSSKGYNDLVLTYLSFWVNPKETEYICGVLSVNIKGFPNEYRFTEKIIIDEAQKIFYGDSLKKYLISNVVGTQLLTALEDNPDFVIIEDEDIQVIRDSIDIPVLFFEAFDEEMPKFNGTDEDLAEFNKIPTSLIQMDLMEPFLRLKKAIQYSIENDSEE